MLDKTNRTIRTHPSLLPLRAALILAERESPARPHRVDTNERLAMQLIARMQARYKRSSPFLSPSERFRKLVAKHA